MRSPAGFCSVSAHRWGWFRRNLHSLESGWKTELVFHPAADRDLPTPGLGVWDRPAPCAPCFHSSPSPKGTAGWHGQGGLCWPGHRDTGMRGHRDTGTHSPQACSGGRRGAGGSRAAPVAWQLPCRSILPKKLFFHHRCPILQPSFQLHPASLSLQSSWLNLA